MSMSTKALIIKDLAMHMKAMTAVQAFTLADELTNQVSAYILKVHQGVPVTESLIESTTSFPRETWNVHTVGVPWEAYSHAYGSYKRQFITERIQALCSAPAQLDVILAEQALSSGLWGGSLLVALGKILESVVKDLVVFSPYWRADGVRSLMASAGRKSYTGVKVTVFSQPKAKMKATDEEGLTFFISSLTAAGAFVQVLAPKAYEGSTPYLHAKLIIADSMMAYVGSANFTKSGLDHGLEAGVLVEGEAANAFAVWSKAIAGSCEAW